LSDDRPSVVELEIEGRLVLAPDRLSGGFKGYDAEARAEVSPRVPVLMGIRDKLALALREET
jgi:hypothetical protein